ncbi:MAG: glycine cleavage T C-terminal barrel domain-containing protein, partial [Methyloceanibacter sp.]
ELLSRLSSDDLSTAASPFAWSREVEIGYARVRASRVTFVGELGWELAIPTEFAAHVFDAVLSVGADLGLRHGGFFAINSMRMEKGYRHWGHDVGEEDTPLEAGLGFAVAFDKKNGFIGRDALLRQRELGFPVRRLVQIAVPDAGDKLLHHDEPIWCGNRIVGSVTSGAYGHRVGAPLGLGYIADENGVTPEMLAKQRFEVEIAWERYPAEVQLGPWYDPKSERVRT